jgi:arabinose-5-phosphate isomerase
MTGSPPEVQRNAHTLMARLRQVVLIESNAVSGLLEQLDDNAIQAVELIAKLKGRLVVTGMGKSGHIAKKVAATFASTGTPAFFVHPAEAQHGDLGMIQPEDVVLAISYSGETEEIKDIAPILKRMGTPLIAITGHDSSSLARLATLHLAARVKEEACPLNLAPTASTTAALVLSDALAMGVLELRGFKPEDFARSHPGGSLGRRLLVKVEDVMRSGTEMPSVSQDTQLQEALVEMGNKRLGMTVVLDRNGKAMGLFTDGDLRRLLSQGRLRADLKMSEAMTPGGQSISPKALASEAANRMDTQRINHLLVRDETGELVGVIGLHDLLEAKIV